MTDVCLYECILGWTSIAYLELFIGRTILSISCLIITEIHTTDGSLAISRCT